MDFDSIKNTVSIKAGRPSWKDLRATLLTHCWNLVRLLEREWERRKKNSGRWILLNHESDLLHSAPGKEAMNYKERWVAGNHQKIHSSIALNMYKAHNFEIQASLPLHCSHGPTCLLHPVYQVLDFICCISFCCKSAAEQITQISIFFKKKINHLFSQQSFILIST